MTKINNILKTNIYHYLSSQLNKELFNTFGSPPPYVYIMPKWHKKFKNLIYHEWFLNSFKRDPQTFDIKEINLDER